jgi:predicted NBD/HSP70 family sugar kinase
VIRQRTAARPESIRRHNLNILLAELHHHGPLSRAELTQNLGLNRSTIGALVSDLTECGLIMERAPGARSSGAGRPSHVVGPRADGPYALAVDVAVRHLEVAAVALGGEVLTRHTVELPEDPYPDDAVAAVASGACTVASRLPSGAWVAGVGISVAGTVRRRDDRVLVAPNLHWHDIDLISLLRAGLATDLPIRIGNDADLAVLAEHIRGAARGVDDVVYLLARVGVGAGILTDGVPLRGTSGLAGPECYCGNRGCFELMVGERALFAMAGLPDASDAEGVRQVVSAAAAGDAQALAAIRQACRWLSAGMAGLSHVLNPELIVIGGSLVPLVDARRADLQRALDDLMGAGPGESAEIRCSGLGGDAPLLGAAEIAFTDLLDAPVETALAHGPMAHSELTTVMRAQSTATGSAGARV